MHCEYTGPEESCCPNFSPDVPFPEGYLEHRMIVVGTILYLSICHMFMCFASLSSVLCFTSKLSSIAVDALDLSFWLLGLQIVCISVCYLFNLPSSPDYFYEHTIAVVKNS